MTKQDIMAYLCIVFILVFFLSFLMMQTILNETLNLGGQKYDTSSKTKQLVTGYSE
jgi:hypothetical protein